VNATGIIGDDPHYLSGVDELLEMLRKAQLPVGPAEAIDTAVVLRHLAATVPPGEQALPRLKSRLRPVLCKSIADAAVFDDVFEEWCRASVPAKEPRGDFGVDTGGGSKEPFGPAAEKTRAWPWVLLAVALLAVALLVVLVWIQPWRNDKPTVESKTSGPNSFPTASTQAPQSAPSREAPSPDKTTTAAPTTFGYFPAVRANEEIRPTWWWALVLLPLLAAVPGMLSAPPLPRISRARGGGQVLLQDWPASKYRRDLVAPIAPAVEARLQRHVHGAVEHRNAYARRPLVDPRRTVAATIGNLGMPALRYRHARLRPAYLVLVAAGRDDAFGILWAQRLRELDMRVDLFRFEVLADGGIPTCTEVGGIGRRFGFDVLPNPEAGERLVILGPTSVLMGADGQLHEWARAAQLSRWEQRALFTQDDPRDWRPDHVQALEQPVGADRGMLVMPLDDNALAAWSEWLVHGRMPPIVLSEPQRYPRLLREDDQRPQTERRFVAETDPALLGATPQIAGELVSRLVSELQVYLGENGFYWLCACAVPPLLDRRLALLLGEQYFLRCGACSTRASHYMARGWRRLVRLPWLRDDVQLPQWLRLALLARLPKSIQDELRDVVRGALALKSSTGQGVGFALQFDDPVLPAARQQHAEATDGPRYSLYVGFLRDGLTAEQLVLRIPGAWNQWLPALLRRPPWWRRFGAAGMRLALRDGIAGRGLGRVTRLLAIAAGTVAIGAVLLAVIQPREWPATVRPWLYAEAVRPVAPQHDGAVTTVAYSADGSRFVTASLDRTARVWDAATGQPMGAPMKHVDAVRTASFNADGSRVVTGSDDGTARIWDAATGEPVGKPLRHDGPVHGARFNGDGSHVVTASANKTARVWDAATGALVRSMQLPTALWLASFSPDGRYVVTVSDDTTVRIWNASTGTLNSEIPHQGRAWYATFSPDGTRVVTASEDKTARVWSLPGFKHVDKMMHHDGALITARFSPDGRRIVTASRDNTARIWDAETGEPVGDPMRHTGPVMSASFSADGQLVVTASDDRTARTWDAETGNPLGEPMRHAAGVISASFSRDRSHVITAARDGRTHVWEDGTNRFLAGPMMHAGSVRSISYSPDGTRVVTASEDGTARIWNAESGDPIGAPMRHSTVVYTAEFSPDGSRVVTASADRTARVWDAGNGKPLSIPMRHNAEVLFAHFLADGKRIVTRSSNDTVRFWEALSIQEYRVVDDSHRIDPSHLEAYLSRYAHYLITRSADRKFRIWDISTRAPVGKPMQVPQGSTVSDVNADGGRALVVSRDTARVTDLAEYVSTDTARVWDTATGKPVGKPVAFGSDITTVSFSRDGKLMVAATTDGLMRLWDTSSGKPVGNIINAAHLSTERIHFSPDGSRIATAGWAVRIWDVARGTLVGVPLERSAEACDLTWRSDGQRLAIACEERLTPGPDAVYIVQAPQAAAFTDALPGTIDRLREAAGSGLPANIATSVGLLLLAAATGGITTWRQTRRLAALRPQVTE
jgi:WD40 repeat protein